MSLGEFEAIWKEGIVEKHLKSFEARDQILHKIIEISR